MNFQRLNRPVIHGAILLVVVLVFYVHTFNSGFMFDDYVQQAVLEYVTSVEDAERETNIFMFTTSPEDVETFTRLTALPWWTNPQFRLRYFRPVATFSHWLDYNVWGSNPTAYHVNNVVWYALLVLLLYLFYSLFSSGNTVAFWAGLVFALAPCHYITVLWVAARNDIICATFLMVSFICYIYFCRGRRPFYAVVCVLSYILALLSKEIAFLFPVLIFAYDWIRLKSVWEAVRSRWKVYGSLAFINCVHFAFYQAYGYGSYWYGEKLLSDYPVDLLKATTLYLISLFYGVLVSALPPDVFPRYSFVMIPLLLFACYMLFLIWKERSRYPEIGLFMLWLFLLLPFIVIPPINDRLLLVPSVGYAYMAGLVICKVRKRWLAAFFVITGVLLPPIINVIQARIYNEVVQSNYTQLHSALDKVVVNKTSRDRLFFLNFPKVGLAGENYMYLALYYELLYHYPKWKVPVYPLSAFDERVKVELLDDHRIRISHPTRYYFRTNTEKLFSLNRTFAEGETFELQDIKISLVEAAEGKVKSIEVEFVEPVDNPSYYLLYFDEGKWQRWLPQEAENPFGK